MKNILTVIKEKSVSAFYAVLAFIVSHKITSAVIVSVVAAILAAVIIVSSILSAPVEDDIIYSSKNDVVSDIVSVPEVESEVPMSSVESTPSSKPAASTPAPAPTPAPTPSVNTNFNYNSDMSPYNNVFLDALKYTGYNLEKERASGRMFASGSNYVLCNQKRGLGWLSKITYDDYGRASGYETTEQGLPNIAHFESKGLVCATYAAYVYFNYLPNVAGIDTSSLDRPAQSYSAHSWYQAAKQWVAKGYSRYIDFTATDGGSIHRDLNINPAEEIPIGSLILLQNRKSGVNQKPAYGGGYCSHISIYAGYVNGYHWVTHVGNENGPEFCAIERMNRNPHPQEMLDIITPPSNIRFSAMAEVRLQDEKGNGIKGVEFKIKNASGSEVVLGTTDQNGVVSKEGLAYGDYTLIHTAPDGYTDDTTQMAISLTTQNNSANSFTLKIKKVEEKKEDKKEESKTESSKQENSSETPVPPGVSN